MGNFIGQSAIGNGYWRSVIGNRAIGNRRRLGFAGAALIAAAMGIGGGASARSDDVPVVVELFTSEGCSSCPPADDLLSDLATSSAVPSAAIIALSEHVDYWNLLGWVDPFSSVQFTQRQNEYAAAAHTDNIYTPEMIVDGGESFVGSDRAAAMQAIRRAAARPRSIAIALTDAGTDVLHIQISSRQAAARGDVWLAITEDGLSSDVKRGENAGRTLRHVAVTRRLAQIGPLSAGGSFTKSVALDLSAAWRRPNLHVVVFVQERTSRRILGAAAIVP